MLKNKVFLIVLLLCISFGLSFAQNDFIYDAKGRRNPFIPLVGKDGRLLKLDKEEGGKSDLVIDGIIYDKNGASYAIVNGQVVGVGDFVGEYRVLKVQPDKVSFLKDDQIKEVMLMKEGAK